MKDQSHKPVLIVIAGPNGSGKTTITSKILHHEWMEDSVYINPDIIAQEKFGDWNNQEAVMKSVKYCEELREQCLSSKHSLIFETVLSIPQKIDYIKRAKKRASLYACFLFLQAVLLSMPLVLQNELWKAVMTYRYLRLSLVIIVQLLIVE